MSHDQIVRQAQQRAVAIYAQRPGMAFATERGTAEVREGLGCRYVQDGHHLDMDMPTALGGDQHAPTPGFFARAAISGCVAIGIKMMAAREGIDVKAVKVSIEQEWDNRGLLGVPETGVVASATHLVIEIEGDAQRNELDNLVARALEIDPWFLSFRDAQPVTLETRIIGG